jgi:hypothetical protein
MGVHKKLMEARIALQAAPLKKSGHNKFAGGINTLNLETFYQQSIKSFTRLVCAV